MIELHQYPAIWNLPSLSPFCVKVEMFLRKNKIPYRVVVEKNPARGPKGKMPFIRDGAKVVSDSTFILQYLSQSRGIEERIDRTMQAQATAFQKMIEEHFYFILLYSRWIDPVGWKILKEQFPALFPPLVGLPFLFLIRSRLQRQAHEQGLGRHSKDEVYELGRQDLTAIADFLGDKPFFLGETCTAIDATVYAFLITVLKQPIESELKAALLSHKNLVAYCQREETSFYETID